AAEREAEMPAVLPQPDELDYALVRLAGTPGRMPIGGERGERDAGPRGWLDVPPTATNPNAGRPLFILQYTRGERLQLAFDPEGILGLNANDTRIQLQVSSDAGASGAPGFDSDWNLIA